MVLLLFSLQMPSRSFAVADICVLPGFSTAYRLSSMTYKHPIQNDNTALQLDFYSPVAVTQPPLMIIIHGGAWKTGNRTQIPIVNEAKTLVGLGFAVAVLDYSLLDQKGPVNNSKNLFPQSVQDVLCAVKFLKSKASTLNFNENRIGVLGHSAGGYLAAMIGVVGGHEKAFDAQLGDDTQCSVRPTNARVQAVAAYYPVTDFVQIAAVARGAAVPASTEPTNARATYLAAWALVQNYMGVDASADPKQLYRASPAKLVTTMSLPPFFIVHGTFDKVVPGQQSEALANQLQFHDFTPHKFTVGDAHLGLNHGFYPWDEISTLKIQNAAPYNMNLTALQVHTLLQASSCALVQFLKTSLSR